MVALSLVLGHILGDFVLQSDACARKKNLESPALITHCLYYFVGMFIGALFGLPLVSAFLCALGISITHAVFDWLMRRWLQRREAEESSLSLFLLDQAAHILVVLIVACALTGATGAPCIQAFWGSIVSPVSDTAYFDAVLVLTLTLFCWKPSAVLVRKILEATRAGNDEQEEESSTQKAGRVIGALERWIVLALGLSGNVGAIGLVVAAKGLARFNKIGEDKNFAEVFLVGTFSSVLLAIIAVLVGQYFL